MLRMATWCIILSPRSISVRRIWRTFENRVRLLLEIGDAGAVGLASGLSVVSCVFRPRDWRKGDGRPTRRCGFCALLKDRQVDVIDCSIGGWWPYKKFPWTRYQVTISERIRKKRVSTGAVGIITHRHRRRRYWQAGRRTGGHGAAIAADPYFPLHAADELGIQEIHWPFAIK